MLLQDAEDRVDAAADTFRRLASTSANAAIRREASERLDLLFERQGAWSQLRDHLHATLDSGTADEDAERHQRMGRLCLDRLGDPEGAADHFEHAARLAPRRPHPWRDLAQMYESDGRHRDVVRALEGELAANPDPERELTLRTQAAALYTRALSDDRRARAHYERIFELDPSHSAAAEYLIAPFEREGQYTRVVQVLEARLDAVGGATGDGKVGDDAAARRASLQIRIAGLRANHLDDVDGAISALESAVSDIGPEAVVAEPLADLYEKAGYHQELVDLCTRTSAATEDSAERANWLLRLGSGLRHCGEKRDSVSAYQRVLHERPDDREARAALRELYRELDQPEELAQLIESSIQQMAGREEIQARVELAAIQASQLGRPAQALTHLRRVLRLDPAHEDALDRALAMAEVLGDDQATLEILDGALDRWQTPAARAGLLARRGSTLAHVMNRPEEAVTCLREALALDSRSPVLRAELRAVLESQGRWAEALDLLYAESDGRDDETRTAVLEQAVATATEKLSPDAALPWLERLRALRPEDSGVLQRIANIHKAAERPGAQLLALDYELRLVHDGARKLEILTERARVLESQLESPALALADLESARKIDPNHLGVLQALDRLYAVLGRHRERAEILEALAGIAAPEERVAVWCEAGALYADTLSDPHRAVYHLMRAVAEAPDPSPLRAELLRALGQALRARGPLDAWARCAEAELSALDPDAPVFADRRLELHRELAGAYENDLGRREAALRHLRCAVDEASDDPASAGNAGRRAAEESLLRLLETEHHVIELEARLTARLTREPEDAERWLDLATLCEQKLHTPASAAAAYRKLVDLAPDSLLGVRGLSRTCERIRDWPGAVHALELEIELAASRPQSERAALHHRLGQILWRELGSNALAVRSFTAALEADETDPDSMHALQELFEEMEDWSSALDYYEREASSLCEADPERRRAIWLHVASLALNQSREDERALAAYQSAEALGDLTTHQRRVLADLHRRVGDLASFSRVLGAWCDDPEAGASCDDHLEVADALVSLGRTGDAVNRVDRALTCDERSVRAWDLAACLREELGNQSRAVEALWRASMLLSGHEAAHRLLQAASICEADDLQRALDLTRAAVERDPGDVRGQTTLARIAQVLAASDEALEAANTALELADALGSEADELAVMAALAGGAAARQVGRAVDALRFFSLVLASQPDHPDALAGRGESLAELGDLAGARRALETRLDRGDVYPARAQHLTLVGMHFVAVGEPEAALERFEAAIRDDPTLDEAHLQIAALHEANDHIEVGIACLERWAALADEPSVRASRLLRAAEWEIRSDGQHAAAERHLRQILEADPGCGRAWRMLTDFLRTTDRNDEALATSTLALAGLEDADVVTPLALTRGQVLEEGGDLRGAAEAYGIAAPHCADAALSRARLLRTLGDWQAAADTLREFVTLHGGANLAGLTESLEQLGQLLAGPLEDFGSAIVVYQRAVQLDPDRDEARQTLAGLLARTPDQWRLALDHLRVLLDSDPTHRASLRTLLDIARDQCRDTALTNGLTILRALGIASEREREEAPMTLSLRVASERQLPDRVSEALRRLAHGAAREIRQALDATENPKLPSPDDFTTSVLAAEASLTAPALLPLSDEKLGEVLQVLATLVLEPAEVHGDGALVNSFSAALGWRSRRRLRRTLAGHSLEALCAVDISTWRMQVRTLAQAVALDDGGGDLRAALEGLVREAADGSIRDLGPSTDLTDLVSGTPAADCLLRRTLHAWMESL